MKYRLDLGDGSFIECDYDKAIARAIKRATKALERGEEPSHSDTIKILLWQEQQEKKYGGIQRPGT